MMAEPALRQFRQVSLSVHHISSAGLLETDLCNTLLVTCVVFTVLLLHIFHRKLYLQHPSAPHNTFATLLNYSHGPLSSYFLFSSGGKSSRL